MRINWLKACVFLFVVVALSAVCAHAAPALPNSSQVPACAASMSSAGDVQRVALGDDMVIERIKGTPALAHLQEILARKPAVFQRARKELEARGFQPTEQVYIERTVRLGVGANPSGPTPTGSYSEANSDGQIIIWAWDDGNDATWEGTIYIEVYADGSASTWEGQINDSTEDHPWVYYNKTFEKQPREPLPVNYDKQQPWAQPPAIVNAAFDRSAPTYPNSYMQVGFQAWALCWRACVVGGCATAAVGCLDSGPLWGPCFGFWCIGAEIGCGLTCALAK